MELTRRSVGTALACAATVSTLALTACDPQQTGALTKKVGDVINQVQQGVKVACAAAGKIIPTANSVIAVLGSILGAVSIEAAAAAQLAAAITTAVAQIAAVGCPSPDGPVSARTEGGIDIEFL